MPKSLFSLKRAVSLVVAGNVFLRPFRHWTARFPFQISFRAKVQLKFLQPLVAETVFWCNLHVRNAQV